MKLLPSLLPAVSNSMFHFGDYATFTYFNNLMSLV